VADSSRIDDLRRRVQKDPASIAFAQLAEECRRAGELQEAVDVCRAGLDIHPGYLSARVTLGRALLELNQLDEAQVELETVLRSAPENLAALRALAEALHRRGDLGDALTQYRAALSLAHNDPDLQETVAELAKLIDPAPPPAASDGLSFEQAAREFLLHAPPPVKPAPPPLAAATPPAIADAAPSGVEPASAGADAALPSPEMPSLLVEEPSSAPVAGAFSYADEDPAPSHLVEATPALTAAPDDHAARDHAVRTIAALEQWLEAVHVTRAHRHA
jgi:tetratricopeptide (TPR) repeat protein